MFSSWKNRVLIALTFALVFAGITLMVVSAQEGDNPPVDVQASESSDDCTVCHTEFQMKWESGAHGQSGSDPVFLADWESQGKPGRLPCLPYYWLRPCDCYMGI